MAMLWLGKNLGLIRSVMILPYHGFGNGKELFFLGRVLIDRNIGISKLEDSSLRNFIKMYKRFMTWKISGAKVEASFEGITKTATTDSEGYFEFRMELPQPISGHTIPGRKFGWSWQIKCIKTKNLRWSKVSGEMLKNANACNSIQYFRLPLPNVFVFFYIQRIFGHRINSVNGYTMFCKKRDETMVAYRNQPAVKPCSTACSLLYCLPTAKAR